MEETGINVSVGGLAPPCPYPKVVPPKQHHPQHAHTSQDKYFENVAILCFDLEGNGCSWKGVTNTNIGT